LAKKELFTMRVGNMWMRRMRKKAKKKSLIRGSKVTVATLIREAVNKSYKIKEV